MPLKVKSFRVELDPDAGNEGSLVVVQEEEDGQQKIAAMILLEPFPDWELIARRLTTLILRTLRGKC